MATYYVDLINGDDANDGSSWAQAWKEMGGHEAVLSPTDTVKIAKTGIPTSLGLSSWTNKSHIVTIPAALTQKIDDCIGNTWTAALGTIGSYTNRKLGASSQNVSGKTSTIGKLAYKTLTELDLSAFRKISLWYGSNMAPYIVNWSICLCSDETGDVIEHEFIFPEIGANNTLTSIVFDNGSPLSNSIKSIAIYKKTASTGVSIRLNNIIACNDFNLHSVIGKSSNPLLDFYPVMAIDGTTVYIDQCILNTAGRGYYGATENIESFFINGATRPTVYNQQYYQIAKSGTSKNEQLVFSGGWNTANNEQDGITIISGGCCAGSCIVLLAKFVSLNRFIFNGYRIGLTNSTTSTGLSLQNISAINCSVSGFAIANGVELENIYVLNNYLSGITLSGSKNKIINAIVNNNGYSSTYAFHCGADASHFENISLNNNYYGMETSSDSGNVINTMNGANNLFINITANENQYNPVSNKAANNTWIDCYPAGAFAANTTVINNKTTLTESSLYYKDLRVINFNGVADANYYGNTHTLMCWQTIVKQDGSNGAWLLKADRLGIVEEYFMLDYFRLAEIAVEENIPIMIKVWIKLDNAELSEVTLSIRKYKSNISLDNDYTATTQPTTEWQQVALLITPAKTGIITLEASMSKSGNAYIGSISTTT